jgi:hypothetical protein
MNYTYGWSYPQPYCYMTTTTIMGYVPASVDITVEDAKYARTFVETITHPKRVPPPRPTSPPSTA